MCNQLFECYHQTWCWGCGFVDRNTEESSPLATSNVNCFIIIPNEVPIAQEVWWEMKAGTASANGDRALDKRWLWRIAPPALLILLYMTKTYYLIDEWANCSLILFCLFFIILIKTKENEKEWTGQLLWTGHLLADKSPTFPATRFSSTPPPHFIWSPPNFHGSATDIFLNNYSSLNRGFCMINCEYI